MTIVVRFALGETLMTATAWVVSKKDQLGPENEQAGDNRTRTD